jgi:hypothetical protein
MPGTIVFRPVEANLTRNTDFLHKMNPYCAFIAGNQRFNSQICKHGGKHPVWNDTVTVPITNESIVTLELMDKDKITKDDSIGLAKIDLYELQNKGSNWYPLYYKNKPAGEILLEATFQGDLGFQNQGQFGTAGITQMSNREQIYPNQQTVPEYNQNLQMQQGRVYDSSKQTFNQDINIGVHNKEMIFEQPGYVQQERFVGSAPVEGTKTFVEQRQHVEPHTFLKEVDVVETRAVQQTIEVMEPQKVLKEVQYTQAVPVKKQIETVEPQVVRKEVEVMEPRLVTKTIQVVENVPVKKQVEVIESVSRIQEVETFEPQTFTKQIEVTEQVPVMKNVTVTEPVHLKKAVEFVEPIITTQTITKEIRPEVIVNEEITKSVGPATYVGEVRELSTKFSQITLTEQERTRYLGMSEQERLNLSEEERWRWHEARRLPEGGYNYGNWSGSQFNQYGQSGQFNQYGQSGQFNLNEKERLRYMNMSEKDRLLLKGEELLRWQEAKRLSSDPAFSKSYAQQGLGGQQLNYSGSTTSSNTYKSTKF